MVRQHRSALNIFLWAAAVAAALTAVAAAQVAF
jgi:hypothetical protein